MAWLEFTRKRPISLSAGNFKKGGLIRPLRGLVLHIQDGYEESTYSWFNTSLEGRRAALERAGKHDTPFNSSAHFGNPKGGQLEQFVDTDDQAYAQKGGNPYWLSVENEGFGGDALTVNQIHNLAQLMAYLNFHEGVALTEANSPAGSGLGYHSMSPDWGHPGCPGPAVLAQRPYILDMAKDLLHGKKPTDNIPDWVLGWWSVNDTNQYYYYFFPSGEVVHTTAKPKGPSAGAPHKVGNHGTVTMTEHGLNVHWRPLTRNKKHLTATIETFTRMGWTSTVEMFGSSNSYGGLSAKKII